MSPLFDDVGKKSVSIIAIVCLILTSVVTIYMVQDIPAPVTFNNGNLNVTGGSTYTIQNYGASLPYRNNGNILVDGGSTLNIFNASVLMKPNSFVNITAGSKLVIKDSTITVDINSVQASYNLFFQILNSDFRIEDSTIRFPGTFNVTNSNFYAINSIFDELTNPISLGSPTLKFNSSYVYYQDCEVNDFDRFMDVELKGSSEFIAINTFFDLDYIGESELYIDDTSTAMLYGVTINPGTWPYSSSPIKIMNSNAYAHIYRWLYLNVTDLLNTPIGDASVSTKNINMDQFTGTPPQYILNYLNKNNMSYNITNSSGYVLLPLISDNLTYSSMPNSIFVGNYKLSAFHNVFSTTLNAGLISYPLMTDSANNPTLTLKFSNLLMSPKFNTYFSDKGTDIDIASGQGIIKDSIYQKPQGGVVNMTFGQQGNIKVSGGKLDMYSTGLGIEQDMNNKYYVLLENTGKMMLAKQSSILDGIVTPGVYPINIYVNNSAELQLKQCSKLKDIGALGVFNDGNVIFDNSELHGDLFYANGLNQNLEIKASNNSKINVTTLLIDNAKMDIENTNVTTVVKPMFSYINGVVKNSSFNHPLTFANGSTMKFVNVSNPDFFKIYAKDSSFIEVYWWLTIVVKDSQGNRLPGVTITVYNYTFKNNQLLKQIYKVAKSDLNGEYMLETKGGDIYFDPVAGKTQRIYGGYIGNYFVEATLGSRNVGGSGGANVFGKNQEVEIIIPGAPDLEITNTDIKTNTDPWPGIKNEELKIMATVHNKGIFNASNIKVEFFDITRQAQMGDTIIIPYLAGDSSTQVSVDQFYFEDGEYNIEVRVDPNNNIGETNEDNNKANRTIRIISKDKPDLTPITITTDPQSPISRNSEVEVGVRIQNVGDANAGSFKVRFFVNYSGDLNSEYQLGNDTIVPGLAFDKSIVATSDDLLIVNKTGKYDIRAEIDVDNMIEEHSEENNSITREIFVVTGPDYTITEISFIPNKPTRESQFSIVANIKNVGPSNSSNFTVGFYLNSLDPKNLIGYVDIPSLNSQESRDAVLPASINLAGEYTIYVRADPFDEISEPNESNNTKWKTLEVVRKADLTVNNIQFDFPEIENGVDANITVSIRNIGGTKSDKYTVRVYDGNPDSTGKQITDDITGSGVEPGKTITFDPPIIWTTTVGGWHEIWVKLFSDNQEIEGSDVLSKSIYVKTKADLTLSAIKTDKENETLKTGDKVEISVTIYNTGDTIARNFNIMFWDGEPDAKSSTRIHHRFIETLAGNSQVNVTKTDQIFKVARNHLIYIVVDPFDNVSEGDKSNNEVHREITVIKTAPELSIVEKDVSPRVIINGVPKSTNIIVNKFNFTISFTIINEGNELAKNITVWVMEDEELLIGNKTIAELGFTLLDNKASVSFEFKANWVKARSDFRKLTLKVDPLDTIDETDEDNNDLELLEAYKVIKADISITGIELIDPVTKEVISPSEIKKGDKIDVRAIVKNLGTEDATAVVHFYIGNSLVYETQESNVSLKAVQGVTFVYPGLEIDGNIEIRAVAIMTSYNGQEEIDKTTNNENFIIVTPKGKNTSDNGENGMLMIMILIIIIIIVVCAVVGALLFMKKKREKMGECSECGALIPIDANTCPKCGAEFTDEIECGECGALMKVTDTKCPVCGAMFTKEDEGLEGAEPETDEDIPEPSAPVKPIDKGKKPTPPKKVSDAPKTPGAPPAPPAKPATGAPVAPPAGKPTDTPGGEEEERAECYRCGAIVPLSASMCPECGAEFE